MHTLILIFRFLHTLGLASVFGGFITQTKQPRKTVNAFMFHGAWTQLVNGLAIVGLEEPDVNHAKAGAKLFLLLLILSIFMKYRKKELPPRAFSASFMLVIVEVAVAIFWGEV